MTKLFIYCLLLIETLIALSQTMQNGVKTEDKKANRGQTIMAVSYLVGSVSLIVAKLIGDLPASFVFFTFAWFGMVMLLASFIQSAAQSMGRNSKVLDVSYSLFFYYSVLLYFIDVYISNGSLKYGDVAVSLPMSGAIQIILHVLFLILYYICLLILLKQYYDVHEKRRERYFVWGGVMSVSFSVIGVTLSIISLIRGTLDILPIYLFSFGSIMFYPRVVAYHNSILLTKDNYKEFLRDDSKEVVLICNDIFEVCFNSKMASVIAESMKDKFEGRKLTDIFILSPTSEEKLAIGINETEYDIPAVYGPMDCKIELHLVNYFDKFNDLLSSVVTVTGLEGESIIRKMENEKRDSVNDKTEEIEVTKDEVFNITKGAKILIVCEDSVGMSVFEKMMQPYMMSIFKAINSEQAMRDIVENTYDLVFIDHALTKTSAYELAQNIRNLNGEYYTEVPLILYTENSMENAYKEFIGCGFNDYLKKPVSAKHLNMILSRWLWKRYSKNDEVPVESVYETDYELSELNNLIVDCDLFYEQSNYVLFVYILRAIKRLSYIKGFESEERKARDIIKAVMFDDISFVKNNYSVLSSALKSRLKD